MQAPSKKVDLALKLPQLRNIIKRDPAAYKEEFLMQKMRFENELEIFKRRPTSDSERFTDLVTFMSHIVSCYKKECERVPSELLSLLESHANTLHPDVRAKLLQACIHLRNKDMIDPLTLLKLSFKLMAVQDKTMRTTLAEFIFNDIKAINLNKTNEKLNKRVQAMLYGLVEEDTSVVARKAVLIMCELYRRRVWTDARTVNVLSKACTSKSIQIAVVAINFFLGIETKMNEDEDTAEAKVKKEVSEINKHEHSKKTKKRTRMVEKQTERNKKLRREQEKKASTSVPLFPAIQLINDPQSVAEKLFQRARSSNEKFDVRLLILNFVSRLIGCHHLLLLSFYSYLQRYLTSHQQDVTRVLAYIVQGCHELVPPEELVPVMKTIAHNFITERCSNEQITVGLNTVREILARVPSILLEEGMEDLVQDLSMYGKKQHKSVMVAAHAILNFVRATHPNLLARKDRGKFHDPNAMPSRFGEQKVSTSVPGADLLDAYERGDILISTGGEIMWKEDLEADGDEEEAEDGWEEVSHEESDSDSDADDGDEPPQLVEVGDEEGGWVNVSTGEGGEDDEGWEEEEKDDDEGWEEVGEKEEEEDDEEEEEGRKGDEWEFMEEEKDASDSRKRSRNVRDRVEGRRVLSEEDFLLIKKLQEAYAERVKDPRFRSRKAREKREREERRNSKTGGTNDENEEDIEGIQRGTTDSNDDDSSNSDDEDSTAGVRTEAYQVTAEDLGAGLKLNRDNKIERIQSVLSGREEEKFKHEGHRGGLTNLEKKRKKNFVMVRKGKRSVTGKLSLSNSVARYQKMNAKKIIGRDKRKRRRT